MRRFQEPEKCTSRRRVTLTERSEVDGESRRQPAVTVRADGRALEAALPFVAAVDSASRRHLPRRDVLGAPQSPGGDILTFIRE